MKIAICHTNLQMLGGGERVALTIASELAKRNHSVVVYGLTCYNKLFFEKYYDIDLSSVTFYTKFGFLTPLKIFSNYRGFILSYTLSKTTDFDLIIDTSSNGFYPIRTNTKTMCYIHYPHYNLPDSILLKIFLFPIRRRIGYFFDSYNKLICNSQFTKNEIKKLTSKNVEILYPPVNIYNGTPIHDKEKLICTVGRISPEKKMEIMISAFKQIYSRNPDWKFAIVGSIENTEYLHKIQQLCKDSPVEFHQNVTYDQLGDIYKRANVYWHARGYDETEKKAFENFGITTVEAMSYSCIPVVINKGGQCEIVDHGENGFRWDSVDELIKFTEKIITNSDNQNYSLRSNAITKSNTYSEEKFRKKIVSIVERIENL
jgi:glycosyltransferase involved in cell wall biosynthesis